MEGLNLGIIRSIEIRLPPLGLQKCFAELVRKVSGIKQSFENNEGSGTTLFKSLAQRAFRGEL
ncbi:hypothetical protein WOB59_00630 [Methylocystis sp. IM4]|uniref:hypothetical protein n=1 Tax=Methylocystis sp. IM4 TaxID=3136560 RepID=UPI003119953D